MIALRQVTGHSRIDLEIVCGQDCIQPAFLRLSGALRRAPMKSALQLAKLPRNAALAATKRRLRPAVTGGTAWRNRLSHQEIVVARKEIEILKYNAARLQARLPALQNRAPRKRLII
jgi:hypothetical protein